MRAKRITVKNELPELLEALCEHPDCPEWLQEAIWDAFANRSQSFVFTADYWRAQLHAQAAHERSHSAWNARGPEEVLEAVQ